jgi:hypothetical protein
MRTQRRKATRDMARLLRETTPGDAPDLGWPDLADVEPAPEGAWNAFAKWGTLGPGRGSSLVEPRFPVFRGTTAQMAGLYPFLNSAPIPPLGAYIGTDLLSGGGFWCHPIVWLLMEIVENPNIMVTGSPGRGKSAFIKSFCLRMLALGMIRILIAGDSKDEYEDLCRALGVEPIALGHGLAARVNPLDGGPLVTAAALAVLDAAELANRLQEIKARRLVTLTKLLSSTGYRATTSDVDALGIALDVTTGQHAGNTALVDPIVPDLVAELTDPSREMIDALRYADRQAMLDDTRHLASALRTMTNGTLAGLFDAATNIRWSAADPIMSLSLKRLTSRGEAAVAAGVVCVEAWAQAANDVRAQGEIRINVRDEAWRTWRLGVDAVMNYDSGLRLSRTNGDIEMTSMHKPGDLLTVGDVGSQAAQIASDVMGLYNTRVHFGQDKNTAAAVAELAGLADTQRDLLPSWGMGAKGRMLWQVKNRVFKVQGTLTPVELALTDTNQNMRGGDRDVELAGA